MKNLVKKLKNSIFGVEDEITKYKCKLCGKNITKKAKKGIVPFIYGFCDVLHQSIYQRIESSELDLEWNGKEVIVRNGLVKEEFLKELM